MELIHTGTPHEGETPHSGRYPWGSGKNPNQRPSNILERVEKLKSEGLSEKEIASSLEMSIRELRARTSLAKHEQRERLRAEVNRMVDLGYSNVKIGEKLGINESTVRSLRDISIAQRKAATKATEDLLIKEVAAKGYIDVGFGVAEGMGISETRLNTAVQSLKDQGYEVFNNFKVKQLGIPGQYTTVKVLAKPGTTFKELVANKEKIGLINERFSDPNGKSLYGLKPIKNISSDRIQIVYAEDGGNKKDGIIELRRGAEGLSMGSSRYAQVRIGVDGTHFLKGMAVYADDLPEGIDIRFNTSKSKEKYGFFDILKPQKTLEDGSIDPDNPFGAVIKSNNGQRGYLNIVNEEGDWSEWKKTLSSQMLSKQSIPLAKGQLQLASEFKKQELAEIESLTNPVVKAHFLEQYADSCDRAAVHLKAAALPRQGSFVILPLDTVKPTDIYAPKYENGESVVLIRYPHGGTFEIPRLRVNNNNPEAARLFKNAQDAVGIHYSVAEQLSGADFDGDTVLVIPDNKRRIRNDRALKELANFDPKSEYKLPKGSKVISSDQKQREMGIVSNLITDMTLAGAPPEHIIRAVRHSMVVIDAEKHELDWKRSYRDNDIEELKKIYQKKSDDDPSKKRYGGSATLISRAKSEVHVLDRQFKGIDPNTGEKIFKDTGKMTVNKQGQVVPKTNRSTKMAEAKDANELVSVRGWGMERLYADYANTMKANANRARKELVAIEMPKKSPSAAQTYREEVESLDKKVRTAIQHQPYERKAQLMANYVVQVKRQDNPNMSDDDVSKARSQALKEMRYRYAGGTKPAVTITNKEWEAIQANAISPTKLRTILNYADQDEMKKLALPKVSGGLTSSQKALAKAMLARGHTYAEIANRLGVSSSTVQKIVKE